MAADGFRSAAQWAQVGNIVGVDGRGHGNDHQTTAGQILGLTSISDGGPGEPFIFNLQGAVMAVSKFGDTRLFHVIADHVEMIGQMNRQG